ncbi:MAG: hypothetical protein ACR2H5_04820 [Ktedonobacteraceae bacterium]
MPRKKKAEPLSGVGDKEERMYEHIKASAKKVVATEIGPRRLPHEP